MIPCEAVPGHPEFLHLTAIAGIDIDLRYATDNNFAERNLYGALDCAWLRHDAANGLASAASWLGSQRPGYRLRVLDALRPQRVQEQLWEKLAGTPLEQYLAHPERGSIHSFGMAVDLTLLDPQGIEMDMGSGFDELSELSHPALDSEHLALGTLSAGQITERGWLRAAMRAGGFHGICSEWWHFDFGDRDLVRRHYARVL
jgi:D-alanyl-D-alanine dipeptidase